MSKKQPIACDITAIDEGERKLHKNHAEKVFTAVEETMELSDGYAFRLPSKTGMIEKAAAFIVRERKCCSFFTFNLEVTPGNGPVWLKLTGDKNVKEFIKQNVIPQINLDNRESWEFPDQA